MAAFVSLAGITCIPRTCWNNSSIASKQRRYYRKSQNVRLIQQTTRQVGGGQIPSHHMVAAEERVEISSKVYELLGYLRCHKSIFLPGKGFNTTTLSLMRKNDTGKSVVPLDEIETNRNHLPGASAIEFIAKKQKEITEIGWNASKLAGAIKSNAVEDIVKYDLAYFLRVISYAVGVQCTDFVHENNLAMTKLVYKELMLPSSTIVAGIEAMKEVVINETPDRSLADHTAAAFDVVINFLSE